MKRISFLLAILTLGAAPALRAQDAATEERLNKLSGRIEDLTAGQESLKKQIEALAKEIENLREQASKPTGNYASQEDLKRVADALKEVDRKRMEDAEKIHNDLLKLGKTLTTSTSARGAKPPPASAGNDTASGNKTEKGYEHVVEKGQTLSVIIQAYRDKGIKVTMDQVLKANPGLKPDKMQVGQKIFIPAPQS